MALLGLGLAACGDASTGSSSSVAQAPTAAATQVPACATGSIKADGSSAIKALVQKAADEYSAKCPDSTITVAATNSSTGVTKASSGGVDVGNSDVPVGLVKGVDPKTVVDHPIAIVTFVVAVNPATKVTNLSAKQIQDIFSGKVTNWKDVGGADLPIAVLERKPGSGTRLSFDKDLMNGVDETSNAAQVIDTTQQLIGALPPTPGGVSYLVQSGLKGTTLVPVTIDNHGPAADNVKTGSYPFFSHEHCFTSSSPSQLTLSFLQYMQTPGFQKGTLTAQGYLPLSTTDNQAAVDK